MQLTIKSRRFWLELCQKIKRTIAATRKQTMFRARKKTKQICFIETVEVNDKIKLFGADSSYKFENLFDRPNLRAVSKLNAVDNYFFIYKTGNPHDVGAGFSNQSRNFRPRKFVSDNPQRRQTQNNVANLSEMND